MSGVTLTLLEIFNFLKEFLHPFLSDASVLATLHRVRLPGPCLAI